MYGNGFNTRNKTQPSNEKNNTHFIMQQLRKEYQNCRYNDRPNVPDSSKQTASLLYRIMRCNTYKVSVSDLSCIAVSESRF
jgi:hypothetical protein